MITFKLYPLGYIHKKAVTAMLMPPLLLCINLSEVVVFESFFIGLISVLSSPTALCSGKESKGLDTKKPQNYLVVCGLFAFTMRLALISRFRTDFRPIRLRKDRFFGEWCHEQSVAVIRLYMSDLAIPLLL